MRPVPRVKHYMESIYKEIYFCRTNLVSLERKPYGFRILDRPGPTAFQAMDHLHQALDILGLLNTDVGKIPERSTVLQQEARHHVYKYFILMLDHYIDEFCKETRPRWSKRKREILKAIKESLGHARRRLESKYYQQAIDAYYAAIQSIDAYHQVDTDT